MMDDTLPNSADGEPRRTAKHYLDAIVAAEKHFEPWQTACDSIDDLLGTVERLRATDGDREFQLFWSNVEVIRAAVYARPPGPVVMVRFRDQDKMRRTAAETLERALVTMVDLGNCDNALRYIVGDALVCGRGVSWIRPTEEQTPDGAVQEGVTFDAIHRRDFLHEPARRWEEVGWVARRAYFTKRQAIRRFGDYGRKLHYGTHKERKQGGEQSGTAKAAVWEVWDKDERVVVWVSPNCEDILDEQPPYMDLRDFFPCPQPCYLTTERDKLIPVPDMLYYKDQLEEINALTARISRLMGALRSAYLVPGSGDLAEAIETAVETMVERDGVEFIPIASLGGDFSRWAPKDALIPLNMRDTAVVLRDCIELRRQFIDDVYQIMGIPDIMRGVSEAQETLGAQQLKAQSGSSRISQRQDAVVEHAKAMIEIAAEVAAEWFSPQTLKEMAQSELPTRQDVQGQVMQLQMQMMQARPQIQQMAAVNPQGAQQGAQQMQQMAAQVAQLQQSITIDDVSDLLRNERLRRLKLDIETDSTIAPDENAEKQRRVELLTSMGGFLAQALPAIQQAPQVAPLMLSMLKEGMKGFRVSRTLEDEVEQLEEALKSGQIQFTGPEGEGRGDEPKPQDGAQAQKTMAEAAKVQAETAQMVQKFQADQQEQAQRLQMDMAKLVAEIEELRAKTASHEAKVEAPRVPIGAAA